MATFEILDVKDAPWQVRGALAAAVSRRWVSVLTIGTLFRDTIDVTPEDAR